MIIKIREYELRQEDNYFNLYHNKVVDKTVVKNEDGSTNFVRNEDESHKREVCIGYGYTLTTALKRIIMNELAQKQDVVDLREYLKEYRNVQKEFENSINQVINN